MADPWEETLSEHLQVIKQVFDIIALAVRRSADIGGENPTVSRRVTTTLLIQIAQDIGAISLLGCSGFPYHAVTVSVSTFEHGMMLASIGSDNARAQRWLDHSIQTQNLDGVRTLVNLALENLDQAHPGLKTALGDPYGGMFTPLCTFKHGNPIVQQHIHTGVDNPLSNFSVANRRAVVAAFWAFEAAIRSGWIALLSFIQHQLQGSSELIEATKEINRAYNKLVKIRHQKETEPN